MRDRNRIRLHTACVNQHGEEVLSGEAWVMPSRTGIVYESRRPALAAMAAWPLSPWTWAAQAVGTWGAITLAMLGATRSAWAAAQESRAPAAD